MEEKIYPYLTKTDIIETDKIADVMKKYTAIEFNKGDMFYDYSRNINAVEFRSKTKTLVKLSGLYLYINSKINPYGITGKNDVARTYTIQIEAVGTIRGYRCKNYQAIRQSMIYEYFRTIEQLEERVKNNLDVFDYGSGKIIDMMKEKF